MHVGHLLTRAAERHPDLAAWLQDDVMLSFRDAEARVNRLANVFLSLFGDPSNRVPLLVPNCLSGTGRDHRQ